MLVIQAVMTLLLASSSPSLIAWERSMAAKSPNEISRAFSASCSRQRYEFEIRSIFFGQGAQLRKFDRYPNPISAEMNQKIATLFDQYADITHVDFRCGTERDGEPAEFMWIELRGFPRGDTIEASKKCDEHKGMFGFETVRHLIVDDGDVTVWGDEVGTCITEQHILEYRRLNNKDAE